MGIEARARSLGRSAAIRVLRAARQLQSKSNLLLLLEVKKKKKKDEEERSEKTRMSAAVGAEKTVCVTAASGCIASCLVKLLLQRRYTVKASVRHPNDPKKTEHLLAPDGAKERLQLFKANLLEEGSFDPVVEGCAGVFHTASPFYHDVKDPQDLIFSSSTSLATF